MKVKDKKIVKNIEATANIKGTERERNRRGHFKERK